MAKQISFWDTQQKAQEMGLLKQLNDAWFHKESPERFEVVCERLGIPILYQKPPYPKVENVDELVIGAYYFARRKLPDGHGEHEVIITQCKTASGHWLDKANGTKDYIPDRSTMYIFNRFWAVPDNNQAMNIFDIYGPIPIPDFE